MDRYFVGRDSYVFRSLDSTNDYCREILGKQEIREGTIVWSHMQLNGRGQAGSRWESAEGQNLTFSVILHPLFLKPSDQFYLSMAVSLGLTGFLKNFSDKVSIKWPNDIYAGNKKIAGILIENSVMENRITDSVLGIGININQDEFGDHIPGPVSLRMITGRTHYLEECLDSICKNFDYWYSLLKRGAKAEIRDRYTGQLFRLNQRSNFRSGKVEFIASVRGVDHFGRLALEFEDGTTGLYNLKEVEFIR